MKTKRAVQENVPLQHTVYYMYLHHIHVMHCSISQEVMIRRAIPC